jgi:hypothetical protein
MTQEYTPTDNDVKADYVRAFCSARNTKNWSENSVKGERAFNRWLAAHDAQIRAEALEFSKEEDREACLALGAALNEQGVGPDKRSPDSIQLNPVVHAISLAVSRYRKEQQR